MSLTEPYGELATWEPEAPRLRPVAPADRVGRRGRVGLAGVLDRARADARPDRRGVPGRRPGRRGQRGAAADPRRVPAAVHGRHRLHPRPARRRARAAARRRRDPVRRPHRRVRRRAARRGGDLGDQHVPAGDPRHQRRRRVHRPRHTQDRPAAGRRGAHERAGDHLPGDRRARAAGAARRDARRQRAEHGELDRRGRLPADRVGDRPVVADRRESGRHPARLQRGHPGVPLGREGDAAC